MYLKIFVKPETWRPLVVCFNTHVLVVKGRNHTTQLVVKLTSGLSGAVAINYR